MTTVFTLPMFGSALYAAALLFMRNSCVVHRIWAVNGSYKSFAVDTSGLETQRCRIFKHKRKGGSSSVL